MKIENCGYTGCTSWVPAGSTNHQALTRRVIWFLKSTWFSQLTFFNFLQNQHLLRQSRGGNRQAPFQGIFRCSVWTPSFPKWLIACVHHGSKSWLTENCRDGCSLLSSRWETTSRQSRSRFLDQFAHNPEFTMTVRCAYHTYSRSVRCYDRLVLLCPLCSECRPLLLHLTPCDHCSDVACATSYSPSYCCLSFRIGVYLCVCVSVFSDDRHWLAFWVLSADGIISCKMLSESLRTFFVHTAV